ncbi:uncharacterized protein IUM83_12447 [Phytophthora cinnamomi]|uniref:uncharacterized protein n=1 Tax=Phytophthora cinnamomi TaxID=4785 RepID=UPI00355AC582|nr:hypothetical protein IUM83_12447 [Phytophthora cinnamomi]
MLEELVNGLDCVPRNKLRNVLVALLWSKHIQEALTLVLLTIFSSIGDATRQVRLAISLETVAADVGTL